MHLVVTGASGFIGRNVLRRAPREWQITAVAHQSPGLEAFVRDHRLDHVRVVRCDLRVPEQVRAAAAAMEGPADAALYLAANGDPARSSLDPGHDLGANAVALVTFLEHWPVRHLVYLSSGAVYDGLSGTVTPETPVAPVLPYAISKLACEQYVRFFAERRGQPASYVNVRFFGAYGPYEPDRKITTRWLRALASGEREFTVRGDGRNLIDFMYVDDAVDGFLKLAATPGTRLTVDFASGAPLSVNDVVATMARALGVEVNVLHQGITEEYITFRSADRTLRDRFGIVPATTFEAGLQRLHSFFLRERGSERTTAEAS
jgi:nucleoside-diphosphate-sugar epimerase